MHFYLFPNNRFIIAYANSVESILGERTQTLSSFRSTDGFAQNLDGATVKIFR